MAEIIPITMAMKPEDLPNRLRVLRKKKGYTLEELAFRAGISAAFLSEMERGAKRLSVYYMDRLAPLLAARPRDLLWPDEAVTEEDIALERLNDLFRRAPEKGREAIMQVAEMAASYSAPPAGIGAPSDDKPA